ncbi:MAG: hypothetical protein OXF02_07180 [Simkaniaceae bacterium]|nr:hypothetical protein [Simkaniaceae bacterium]
MSPPHPVPTREEGTATATSNAVARVVHASEESKGTPHSPLSARHVTPITRGETGAGKGTQNESNNTISHPFPGTAPMSRGDVLSEIVRTYVEDLRTRYPEGKGEIFTELLHHPETAISPHYIRNNIMPDIREAIKRKKPLFLLPVAHKPDLEGDGRSYALITIDLNRGIVYRYDPTSNLPDQTEARETSTPSTGLETTLDLLTQTICEELSLLNPPPSEQLRDTQQPPTNIPAREELLCARTPCLHTLHGKLNRNFDKIGKKELEEIIRDVEGVVDALHKGSADLLGKREIRELEETLRMVEELRSPSLLFGDTTRTNNRKIRDKLLSSVEKLMVAHLPPYLAQKCRVTTRHIAPTRIRPDRPEDSAFPILILMEHAQQIAEEAKDPQSLHAHLEKAMSQTAETITPEEVPGRQVMESLRSRELALAYTPYGPHPFYPPLPCNADLIDAYLDIVERNNPEISVVRDFLRSAQRIRTDKKGAYEFTALLRRAQLRDDRYLYFPIALKEKDPIRLPSDENLWMLIVFDLDTKTSTTFLFSPATHADLQRLAVRTLRNPTVRADDLRETLRSRLEEMADSDEYRNEWIAQTAPSLYRLAPYLNPNEPGMNTQEEAQGTDVPSPCPRARKNKGAVPRDEKGQKHRSPSDPEIRAQRETQEIDIPSLCARAHEKKEAVPRNEKGQKHRSPSSLEELLADRANTHPFLPSIPTIRSLLAQLPSKGKVKGGGTGRLPKQIRDVQADILQAVFTSNRETGNRGDPAWQGALTRVTEARNGNDLVAACAEVEKQMEDRQRKDLALHKAIIGFIDDQVSKIPLYNKSVQHKREYYHLPFAQDIPGAGLLFVLDTIDRGVESLPQEEKDPLTWARELGDVRARIDKAVTDDGKGSLCTPCTSTMSTDNDDMGETHYTLPRSDSMPHIPTKRKGLRKT